MTAKPGKTVYLTIHGHFYQPPRENPWTETIELQPSANPFHDWNDRILIQCYQPNAMARVVDSKGKVLEIVNNFRLLSFNIGPTLMTWLEKATPFVYRLILEGDRLSTRERSGHGNAIAQVYNHMILPLAEERDQRTQIRWGIAEFKKRFGRVPEGMWLPETAANPRSLEILIEEGIHFTILAPHQAVRFRRVGASHWEEAKENALDPTRPYRFFHSQDSKRWIDLFFFDGPLSRDMSFSDLLFDARKFMDRLMHAHRPDRHHPELIHTASDGETFGHHKAYGERVIAFLLHEEAERHGFKRTNYGEYLEKFPPQYEVEIHSGEGTSWSCAHGVARWKEDCGCHTGGPPGWNQKWRSPLREAIRFLEARLGGLFQKEAENFFRDPWAARDHYIDLILDRSAESQHYFFEKHAKRILSEPEWMKALKLLEMERFAMLSETSCGWFFNDISGIETVQILRYAFRAVELAREFGASDLEEQFLGILGKAKSNMHEFKDGRGVWERLVKPSRISRERLVAHYAFRKLFELKIDPENFYNFRFRELEINHETHADMSLLIGTLEMTGKIIPESGRFMFAIFQKGLSDIRCFVKSFEDPGEFHQINGPSLSSLRKSDAVGLMTSLEKSFSVEPIFLRDLFPEERDSILRVLSQQMQGDYRKAASRFYKENQSWAELFHEAGRPLPEEFRTLVDWMMGEKLFELVQKLERPASFEEIARQGKEILREADSRGFSIRIEATEEFLSAKMNGWIQELFQHPDLPLIHKIEKVLDLAKELKIELHGRVAQDLFFVFAQKILRDRPKPELTQAILHLGNRLGFNMERYKSQLETAGEER